MAGYIHALDGGVALQDALPYVSRPTWRTFAATLDLPNRYPGIRGIGVIYRVRPEERSEFLSRIREDGAPAFVIKDVSGADEPATDTGLESYVITYIEPEERNLPAVGLDVGSEPNRRSAAETSRDEAGPVMTRRITLVQDGQQRPGFLLYTPFYTDGHTPATVQERQRQIRGWVYAPFVTEEFVQQGLHAETLNEIDMAMFDGESMQQQNLIFSTDRQPYPSAQYEKTTQLKLAGQVFTFGWNRRATFAKADRSAAVWAGGFSLGMALLLAALVSNLQSKGRQARKLIDLQSAELTQQKFALDQHAIVAVTNVDGRITYANDMFCAISGYSREELIGQNHRVLRSGLHLREHYDEMYRTITSGKVWRGEFCNRAKDGKLYWVASTIVPFVDQQGRPTRYIAIQADITARKVAEQKLRDSQNRLSSIFGAINEGILLFDASMRPIECNAAAERLLGLTRQQLERSEPPAGWQLRAEDGQIVELSESSVEKCFHTGKALHGLSVQIEKPDGSVTWLSVNCEPIIDSTGLVQAVVCSLYDTTERRLAETALREAAQRLALAAEAADLGVWDWDIKSGGIVWDPRMFRIYGMPLRADGRVTYSDWAARVHPDDLPAQEKALWETVDARGQGQRFFRIVRQSDGSVRHIQAQELVLTDRTGKAVRVIGINRDITASVLEAEKRCELESSLEKARDEALTASRLKSEFLATMSHEIRTPMNGVIGMAHLLLQSPLDKKQQDMAQVLVHSADGLLTIINDILDFSKIEAGKLRIDPIDFNLQETIEETVALLAPTARRKGLTFTAEIASALSTHLHGDSGRIQQILTNLIGNAVKFTEHGEVRVVAAATQSDEKMLQFRITVSDTGVGIPDEARERLFQPFVQGDASTTRRFGGTGLGLAISKQLISLMHGELGFQSAEGLGSSFWFELTLPRSATSVLQSTAPRGRARPPKKPQARSSHSENCGSNGSKGLRLLVAEDNETNQIVARSILEQLGYSLVVANNGREVLEQLIGQHFDAVLMDCQMPVLDGYETTERIRNGEVPGISPEIPIIAVTAYAMPADRARALEAGMDDYVSKPLSVNSLQAAFVRCGLIFPQEEMAAAGSRAAEPAGSAVFDPTQREKLLQIPTPDGTSVWDRALSIFLSEMPARMETLRQYVDAQYPERAAVLAHTIAGSAASLGAPELRAAALSLELAAKAKESARMPELLSALSTAWIRLETQLRPTSFP